MTRATPIGHGEYVAHHIMMQRLQRAALPEQHALTPVLRTLASLEGKTVVLYGRTSTEERHADARAGVGASVAGSIHHASLNRLIGQLSAMLG
jgi:hypothetical protein